MQSAYYHAGFHKHYMHLLAEVLQAATLLAAADFTKPAASRLAAYAFTGVFIRATNAPDAAQSGAVHYECRSGQSWRCFLDQAFSARKKARLNKKRLSLPAFLLIHAATI